MPLAEGQADVAWPCDADDKYIVHFPETHEIISYGSGYGGNALLGKKCFALRIASVLARDDGWLAEHMLILKLTNPAGESRYVTGAFPSACGKTNLAMLVPTLPGWKVETDRRRHLLDEAGPRRSPLRDQPRGRVLRRRPGHQHARPTPTRCYSIEANTIFTNTALTADGDVWWEGMGEPPEGLIDWKGQPWSKELGTPAAHPNSRFTAPADQDPAIAPEWEDPAGVPIDAILFGGRRASVVPLVFQSRDWDHGVFLGSIMASETTAAATGAVGNLRRDPFAMLPFCGYNMADYFAPLADVLRALRRGQAAQDLLRQLVPQGRRRTLAVARLRREQPRARVGLRARRRSRRRRRDADRLRADDRARSTSRASTSQRRDMTELLTVHDEEWRREVPRIREHFAQFGDRLPPQAAPPRSTTSRRDWARPRPSRGSYSAVSASATMSRGPDGQSK